MSSYTLNATLRLSLPAREAMRVRQKLEQVLSTVNVRMNTAGLAQNQQAMKSMNALAQSASTANASLAATFGTLARGKSIMTDVSRIWSNASTRMKSFATGVGLLNNGLHTQTGLTQKTASTFGTLAKSLGGVSLASLVTYRAISEVNNALRENVELQNTLINLAQIRQTSFRESGLQGLARGARQTGQEIGSDPNKVLASLVRVRQAGLEVNQELQRLFATASLSAQITDLNNLADAYIVTTRSMKLSQSSAREWLDTILNVAKSTAATTDELLQSTSILGNVVDQLGGSYKDLYAIVGEVKSQVGRPISEISRSINTALARILNQDELQNYLESFGRSMYEFRDGERYFKGIIPSFRIINNLLGELGGPKSERGAELINKVFGIRRTPIGAGLLASAGRIQETRTRLDSPIEQLNRDAEIAQEGISNQLKKIQRQFIDTMQTIAGTDAFRVLVKGFMQVGKGALSLINTLSPLLPMLAVYGIGRFTQKPYAPQYGLRGQVPGTGIRGMGSRAGGGLLSPITSRIPTRSSIVGPDIKQSNRNVNTLTKLYKREIMARSKNISSADAERIARQKSADAVIKGTKVWKDFYGRMRGTGAKGFARATGANVMSAFAGKGTMLYGGAVLALSAIGKEGPKTEAALTGLTSAFILSALGVHGFIAGIAGVIFGLVKYSEAIDREVNKLKNESLAKSLETIISTLSRFSGEGSFAKSQRKIAQEKALSDVLDLQDFGSKEQLSGFGRGLRYWANSAKAPFAWMMGTEDKTPANIKAGLERQKTADQAIRQRAQTVFDYRKELVEQFKSYDDFKLSTVGRRILEAGRQIDYAMGNAIGTFDRETQELFKTVGSLDDVIKKAKLAIEPLAEGIRSLTQTILSSTPQTLRSTNMESTSLINRYEGLSNVGTSGFARDVGNLPPEFNRGILMGINKVASELPRILTGKEFDTDFVDVITEELRTAGVGDGVLSVLERGLKELGLSDFNRQLDDIGALTNNLINEGFGPLLNRVREGADAIAKYNERLVENAKMLTDQWRSRADAGSKLDDLTSSFIKTQAEFKNQRLGINFGNLNAQRSAVRLAGTARVDILETQLIKLEEMFRATGDIRLVDQIKLVKDALGKLADESGRTQDAFSRLSQLESERSAVYGIAQKFYGGNIRDRMESIRGMRETRGMLAGGMDFNDVPPEVARRVIETLSSLGSATTNITGGLPADEVLEKLTAQSLGFEYKGDEERNLQKEILNTQLDAMNAQKALLGQEESLFRNLVSQLSAQNKAFLNELARIMSGGAPIPKFAQGGVVPGFGNKDNVLAMLTPGEIVLNKKHQSLLKDHIPTIKGGPQSVGKYQTGGKVTQDKKDKKPKPLLLPPQDLFEEIQRINTITRGDVYRPNATPVETSPGKTQWVGGADVPSFPYIPPKPEQEEWDKHNLKRQQQIEYNKKNRGVGTIPFSPDKLFNSPQIPQTETITPPDLYFSPIKKQTGPLELPPMSLEERLEQLKPIKLRPENDTTGRPVRAGGKTFYLREYQKGGLVQMKKGGSYWDAKEQRRQAYLAGKQQRRMEYIQERYGSDAVKTYQQYGDFNAIKILGSAQQKGRLDRYIDPKANAEKVARLAHQHSQDLAKRSSTPTEDEMRYRAGLATQFKTAKTRIMEEQMRTTQQNKKVGVATKLFDEKVKTESLSNRYFTLEKMIEELGYNPYVRPGSEKQPETKKELETLKEKYKEMKTTGAFRSGWGQTLQYNVEAFLRRNGVTLQSGGMVPGFGSGDKIPALLEPGEFVLNKNAVQSVGIQKLDSVNRKFNRQKLASGGPVTAESGGPSIDLLPAVEMMNTVVQSFSGVTDRLQEISDTMNTLTVHHKIEPLTLNCVFNGLSVMKELEPKIAELATKIVVDRINYTLKTKFNGDVGVID